MFDDKTNRFNLIYLLCYSRFDFNFHFLTENTQTHRIHRVLSIVSNVVPGFLKSSVLGSTLFYVYDKFFESTKSGLTEILKITSDSISSSLRMRLLTSKSDENSAKDLNPDEPYNGIFIADSAGNSLFVVWISSMLVGSLGGTVHALLHVSWDAASATVNNLGVRVYVCMCVCVCVCV